MSGEKVFRDYLGNEVKIGDFIFHMNTGRWPEAKISRIVAFGKVHPLAVAIKSNRGLSDYEEGVRKSVKQEFVKVDFTPKTDDEIRRADKGLLDF